MSIFKFSLLLILGCHVLFSGCSKQSKNIKEQSPEKLATQYMKDNEQVAGFSTKNNNYITMKCFNINSLSENLKEIYALYEALPEFANYLEENLEVDSEDNIISRSKLAGLSIERQAIKNDEEQLITTIQKDDMVLFQCKCKLTNRNTIISLSVTYDEILAMLKEHNIDYTVIKSFSDKESAAFIVKFSVANIQK